MTHALDRKRYRLLTSSAMFAAIIALTTAYLFHIPIGANGGYVHLGDAFIYLAASVLPWPYACAAAAIGGGLADLLSGAPIWLPATILIKPLNALCFSCKGERLLTRRNALMTILSGVITMVGYSVAEAILVGDWRIAIFGLFTSGLAQPVGSAVVYLVMAGALDRMDLKKRLFL